MNPPTGGIADRLLAAFFRALAREIVPFLPPRRPRPVSAYLVREDHSMLVYSVTLPTPRASDVATRRLSVNIDGTTTDRDLGIDDPAPEVSAEAGQVVVLTLIDIDEAGNASLPSEPLSFTAADTIAPAQPGALGVELIREE